MAGITLDPKTATVLDFMVPLPSSPARAVNIFGDPVGTDDAVQRIVQIMTGGTYPLPVDAESVKSLPGYGTLFSSGVRPSPVDPSKGYDIGGEFRPLTDVEIKTYTTARGEALVDELSSLGTTTDKKLVRQAVLRADSRALEAVGATVTPISHNVPTAAQSPAAASRASGVPVAGGFGRTSRAPASRTGGFQPARGIRVGRSRGAGYRRGPSLGRRGRVSAGRGLRIGRSHHSSLRRRS